MKTKKKQIPQKKTVPQKSKGLSSCIKQEMLDYEADSSDVCPDIDFNLVNFMLGTGKVKQSLFVDKIKRQPVQVDVESILVEDKNQKELGTHNTPKSDHEKGLQVEIL